MASHNQKDVSTLGQTLEKVQRSEALSERQRSDMASALRTVERVMGKPLAIIPSDMHSVREVLHDIRPALHGLSQGRWANIRSLIFKAVAISEVTSERVAWVRQKPSAAWLLVLERLPYKPYRLGLLPFVRYCTMRGIEMHQVTSSVFAEFEREVEQTSRGRDPRESYLNACRSWNAAARDFDHWARLRIVPENRRKWYVFQWSDFPSSLKADVDAMIEASLNPDPLSPIPVKAIRKPTARGRERALRAFASAIVHRGYAPARLQSIADLVNPKAAREGLLFFIGHTQRDKSAYLRDFARLLVTLARHWVYRSALGSEESSKARDETVRELEGFRKLLTPRRTGMTEKNRRVLREFDDDEVFRRLLSLPARVWRKHQNMSKSGDLVKLQLALATEFLIVAPIRRQNLLSLRIDRNLIFRGSGRGRRVHLFFPADEVKNEVEIEFELPKSTVDLLDRYLADLWPRLTKGRTQYLFLGADGAQKCDYVFSNQIANLTAREIGVRITPHQFRHIAGFQYLKTNPGGHEVVRRLLGHKSIQTTLEFYAGMEVGEAVRRYDRMISEHRADALRPMRRRNRKSDRSHDAP